VPPPAYPGAPQPYGWTPPPNGPKPDLARVGKFLVAGVAAVVLMVGSAVGGGAVALALNDGPSARPTYEAAPVIDSADLPAIAESVRNSVVSISVGNGGGSGVVLTADGYILTNNHVVAEASGGRIGVVFADGARAAARVVGTDPRTDLAVIKADGVSDLSPATFGDSDAMRVGDTVLALGSPLGLDGSVTAGIISAKNRSIRTGGANPLRGGTTISGLLQTDAPINPGNSGGALVNTRAEVIGINTAIATAGEGSGNIGLGFAIPSNKAKAVADALMKGQKISHPTLGVSVTDAEGGGALVAAVVPGSPAEQAGLQQGDVITRFGDRTIHDSDELVAAVQAGKVGDRVEVTYKRNGVEQKATVTLAEAS
jgi:putative serine protease PepD